MRRERIRDTAGKSRNTWETEKGRISKGLIITKLYSTAALVVYRARILTYRRTVITALPLSTSVPTLFVSATSLCDSHPFRRFADDFARDLTPLRVVSFTSPSSTVNFTVTTVTTSSQCAIVKLFSRKKRAVSLARMIYRSRVARNRDKNSTIFGMSHRGIECVRGTRSRLV